MDAGELGSRNVSVNWLEVPAGASEELRSHEEAEQVYVVVRGSGTMSATGDTQRLERGRPRPDPAGHRPPVANDGADALALVSVQSPPRLRRRALQPPPRRAGGGLRRLRRRLSRSGVIRRRVVVQRPGSRASSSATRPAAWRESRGVGGLGAEQPRRDGRGASSRASARRSRRWSLVCREGPRGAVVERVEVSDEEPEGLAEFRSASRGRRLNAIGAICAALASTHACAMRWRTRAAHASRGDGRPQPLAAPRLRRGRRRAARGRRAVDARSGRRSRVVRRGVSYSSMARGLRLGLDGALVQRRPQGGEDVVVDVTGRGADAGVYRLPAGSRVNDAVQRAGGATARAERRGDQPRGAARRRPAGRRAGKAPRRRLRRSPARAAARLTPATARSASARRRSSELDTIEGIGPVTAQNIIDFRDQHGGVSSVDQLDQINGIGPATMEALRARLQP